MSGLMASTVSFHSGPFIARIHVIFLFVVAWRLARKFDRESILEPFFRSYHSASVHTVLIVSSRFSEKSGLQNCFAR